jgi:hypothetical protein
MYDLVLQQSPSILDLLMSQCILRKRIVGVHSDRHEPPLLGLEADELESEDALARRGEKRKVNRSTHPCALSTILKGDSHGL